MTSLNVNFDDATEPTIAPAGTYDLQITQVDVKETGPNSKVPGTPMYRISIGFVDNPDYLNLSHFAVLPSEEDDAKAINNKVLGLKRLLVAFKVPFQSGELDLESLAMDMVGATARCEVGQTEPNADGAVYNNLKLPRIPEEFNSRVSRR